MGDTIQLIKGKHAVTVPVEQAGQLVAEGYTVESPETERQRNAEEDRIANAPNAFVAGSLGAARGLTLGLSDVAGRAIGGKTYSKFASTAAEAHPTVTGATQLAGAIAPALFGDEAGLLGYTPAGAAGRAGSSIAEGLGGAAGTIAGGALEGSAFNAGSYVSDQALGDRDLTAEGFIGAMGKGALWGGGASAGLLGIERGLGAARKLFPAGEVTKEAASRAEGEATQAIAAARRDADALQQRAGQRMQDIRTETRVDPVARARQDAVAAQRAQEIAAEAQPQQAVDRAVGATPTPQAAEQAVAAPAPSSPDDLMGQLQQTQQQLQGGASLGDLSKRGTVEDAVNEHIAQTHPEMEAIHRANKEMGAAVDQMDAWRSKYPGGMVELDQMTPAARRKALKQWAEGYEPTSPTGETVKDFTLHGSGGTKNRLGGNDFPEDVTKSARKDAAVAGRQGYLDELARATNVSTSAPELMARATYGGRQAAAKSLDETFAAHRAGQSIDDQIRQAIRVKATTPEAAEDLDHVIDTISRFERAHAELTNALGPNAPLSAGPQAAAYREAEAAAQGKTAEATARATAAAEKSPGALQKATAMANQIGQGAELLRMLGVNVPDPKDIPIIGPILSLYLKAKIAGKMLGKIGMSPEGVIAGKAAGMRNAALKAAGGAIDVAKRGVSVASSVSTPVAVALGNTLFKTPGKAAADVYTQRTNELAEALRPGVIQDAVAQHIGASDPAINDAIAATLERKLSFLDAKRPKPMNPPNPLEKETWTPDKQRLIEWGRYVEAAEHPEGVLAQIGRGQMPSHEALETLRTVYPKLWQETQMNLAKQLQEHAGEISYAKRVQLSVIYRLPLDQSMAPGFAAASQMGYGPTQPPMPPQQGAPTIKADVNIGKVTQPRVDG